MVPICGSNSKIFEKKNTRNAVESNCTLCLMLVWALSRFSLICHFLWSFWNFEISLFSIFRLVEAVCNVHRSFFYSSTEYKGHNKARQSSTVSPNATKNNIKYNFITDFNPFLCCCRHCNYFIICLFTHWHGSICSHCNVYEVTIHGTYVHTFVRDYSYAFSNYELNQMRWHWQ